MVGGWDGGRVGWWEGGWWEGGGEGGREEDVCVSGREEGRVGERRERGGREVGGREGGREEVREERREEDREVR